VIGTDVDVNAIRCARPNGVLAVRADLGTPLRDEAFDIVTVVAPYVPTGEIAFLPADVRRYEPDVALDGGEDGLDVVRRASATAARLLKPDGWFLAEVGGNQGDVLERVLATLGSHQPGPWFDDEGDLRGIIAQLTRTTCWIWLPRSSGSTPTLA
jgi:release factor glutamine methyltransferase